MSRRAIASFAIVAALSGCATHRPPIAVAPPAPAPIPVQAASLPPGAYPGMAIPARLPDGGYATPNRGLGEDGAVWHLRATLNVAALACRGAQGDAIVAGYNAMLDREKAPLAAAQARYAAGFRERGASAYDDAMTRLYNFFSQAQVRDGFCAAAAQVLAESANVADAANLLSFGFQFEQFNAGQPNSPVTITLRNGAGTDGGIVATRTVTLPAIPAGRTGTWYDFDLTGTTLAAGATYTALVSTGSSLLGLVYGPDLDIYTGQPLGGDGYTAGAIVSTRALDTYCITSGACDTNFRFTTQAAAGVVPEPGSWAIMLLGSAFVGAAMRRPRSRIANA